MYEESAAKLNPLGLWYLGFSDEKNNNLASALSLYSKVAEAGWPVGYHCMGRVFRKQKDITKAKEFFNKSADLGYPPSFFEIYQLNGSVDWNVNPFNYFIPQNRDMRYVATENTETHVSTSGPSMHVSSYSVTASYSLVIEYTGPVELAVRKLFQAEMPNFWSKQARALGAGGDKKLMQISNALAESDADLFLADALRKADLLLTERLASRRASEQKEVAPVKVPLSPSATSLQPAAPKASSPGGAFSLSAGNELFHKAKTEMKLAHYQTALTLFGSARDHLKYCPEAADAANKEFIATRLEKIKTKKEECTLKLR